MGLRKDTRFRVGVNASYGGRRQMAKVTAALTEIRQYLCKYFLCGNERYPWQRSADGMCRRMALILIVEVSDPVIAISKNGPHGL
jgi:hypothetical protein